MNTFPHATLPVDAKVMPVFLPVGQLDEIICIAFVGWTSAEGAWARAVATRPLGSLPNDVGHAMASFGNLVAEDFLQWCRLGRPMHDWTPPLGGLRTGEWVELQGFDANDAIRLTLSMSAFAAPMREPAEAAPSLAPRSNDESRFLEAVKTEVLRTKPSLSQGFRRSLSLTGKGSVGEIDFVGKHYVTCYAAVNPRGMGVRRAHSASAALWRLARARDMFGFAAPTTIELTAWVPPLGLPIFTATDYQLANDTVDELRAQAAKEALNIHTSTDVASAGQRLIQMEVVRAPAYS